MSYFIQDQRQNPTGKSLPNRQRFVRKIKGILKERIKELIRDKSLGDIGKGDKVKIPTKSTREPSFRPDHKTGNRTPVFPGNKQFGREDRIPKPPGGGGGGGKEGSPDGDGEDDFFFTLSRDEFLDLFFEDLELPNLEKKNLKELLSYVWRRAGFTRVERSPANLDVLRTMRERLGRSIALHRPKESDVNEMKEKIQELEAKDPKTEEEEAALKAAQRALEELLARMRRVPFIDPVDRRYHVHEKQPRPIENAVIFCLMDVSGSMGQHEKDLAKSFFLLLHSFLVRRYKNMDLVFIRHTHQAKEVDEQEFFYSTETGGTIVSTALEEMMRIVKERYPVTQWNIYAAQASDGDNWSGDSAKCIELLGKTILPLCQYFAYIETVREEESYLLAQPLAGAEMWLAYLALQQKFSRQFAMRRVGSPGHIYPVFRDLFKKQGGVHADA